MPPGMTGGLSAISGESCVWRDLEASLIDWGRQIAAPGRKRAQIGRSCSEVKTQHLHHGFSIGTGKLGKWELMRDPCPIVRGSR